ncbi:MAG TPA: hypothetical protein P5186_04630 [Candidatus Paceibacterota bacterium]|nr:hypothetical protein [Verrucomicrobiota bacterium]HRY47312.1 hypothetical protein [Candidatus Paceibacterota bacterium]HSA02572.1 hypothetical protein [Candidatus Paceibacterota bacterium]
MKTMMKYSMAVLALAGMLWAGGNIAAATKANPPKPYPLETCAVTGEKLGGMGKPYVFTHEGREIKLCCKGCLKEFNKNTAKYIKKLEEAEKKSPQKTR